jgi:hypothetical protein
MIKRLKDTLFGKKKDEEEEVSVESRKASTIREKLESYGEAVAFAEEGLHEEAREIIHPVITEKIKVMVVGNEDSFSPQVVEYAVGFAERMSCEIIALNVSPVSTESSSVEAFREELREKFKTRSEENVAGFRDACGDKEIDFTHLVKFGEVEDCIKEACEELRRVEFVVTEPECCPEEEKVTIPVFCMVH